MEVWYEKGKKYNCLKNGVPYFRKTATIGGKRRYFYGDGEKDANKKIEEAKSLTQAGYDYDKRTARVGSVFRYWLFSVKRVDKNIKASTFARYDCAFRNHIENHDIAQIPLSKLDSVQLQEYVTGLYEVDGLSGANIKCTIKVWKMFLEWAIDEGYLTKDPCRHLALPGKREKGVNHIEVFEEPERKLLIKYMEETRYQYDTVVLLAFATGMRQGELLGLRWEDIYDDAIHVSRSTAVVTHVNKNGERSRYREVWDTKTENAVRLIPLLPATKELLSEHKKKQKAFFGKQPAYVFTTNTGELIDQSSFHKSFDRLLERAGIEHRKFHAIRHTFATEAIRRGVDVKDLQMLMGHSDIETTYIYVHATEDSKRKAINLMGELI